MGINSDMALHKKKATQLPALLAWLSSRVLRMCLCSYFSLVPAFPARSLPWNTDSLTIFVASSLKESTVLLSSAFLSNWDKLL